MSVGFILAEAFTLTAFSTFVDALRLAADEGDGSRQDRCRWSVMSADDRPVRSSSGIAVEPTTRLEDPSSLDYLVVVGGLLPRSGGPAQPIDAATARYLESAATSSTVLVGICTGSFVLARQGLLSGRRACVSWYHYRDFRAEFPDVEATADRLFLVDGNRITCSGGTGAADLAAFLVERHLGSGLARKSMNILQLDRARPGVEPQPQPPSLETAEDPRVRRALLMMEQHIGEPRSVEAIAGQLEISARQLERLFREALGIGPNAAYAKLRLRHADWLLQMTERSVTEVALECGFADCAHLSRAYKAGFGLSPTAARRGVVGQPTRGLAMAGPRLFDST